MAKRYVVVVCVAILAAAVLLVNAADRPEGTVKVVKKPGGQHPPSAHSRTFSVAKVDGASFGATTPKAFGTIVYDTLGISAIPNLQALTFGNRFNSALNPAGTALAPVQVSGSLTYLSWGMWGTTTQPTWANFYLTIFGPVSGTTAPVITSLYLGGPGGSAPLLVAFPLSPPVNYVGPSFLVGFYNSNSLSSPPWNGPCPILDTGTVGGQGHHGMVINWNTTAGTGFFSLTSLNSVMRANGNVLTPVELMNFTVE